MSKGFLGLILLTGVFGLLALCVLLFLPMLLESSMFRPKLEQWVSSGVGRPVLIQGPVQISLVPAIRLRLSRLHVPSSDGSPEKDLMSVESVEMESAWGHILRNGLKPVSISLHGLHLVTEMNREKALGWLQAPGRNNKQQGSDAPHTDRANHLRLRVPRLGLLCGLGLRISEAELVLMDSSKKTQGKITGISLSIGKPSSEGSQAIKAQGNFQGHPFLIEGFLQEQKETQTADRRLLIELSALAGGKLRGSMKGHISAREQSPEAHFEVHVEPFPLQALLMAVGHNPKGSFLESWNQVSFQGNLLLSKGSFELSQAVLQADDLIFRLSMAAAKGTQPALVVNLETEELDLGWFFEASADSKAKKRSPPAERPGPKEQPRVSAAPEAPGMPLFPLAGSAKIHKVLLRSQPLEGLQVSYRFWEGVLELEEIRVGLQGGELWGRGSVDFHTLKPHVHFYLNTRDVQVGPVLQRLAGTVFLEGRMESRWDLEGPWEGDLDQAAVSWKGQADILLKDGNINGVDLAKVSRSLGLAGNKEKKHDARAKTHFSRLEAHLVLEDGSVKVSKATMQNKDLRILAAGRADLIERSLDFRLEPELGFHEEDQKEASLVVPFWVEGSFSHPKFHPDLAGIKKKGEGKLHLSLPSAKDLKEVLRNLLKGR